MTRDARTVTRRARALAARRETQVWILANLAECLALSAGRVPPVIRRQAVRAAEVSTVNTGAKERRIT